MLKRKIFAYIALTRVYMCVMGSVIAVCGAYLAQAHLTASLVASVFIAQLMIGAAGFGLNDILDRERDVNVRCKPIPTGRLTVSEAVRAVCLFATLGIGISAALGTASFLVAVGQILLIYGYSSIKRWSGLIGNLLTAALCASGYVFGGTIGHTGSPILYPVVLTMLLITSREIVKDVLDLEPDARANLPTVPLKYGLPLATTIVALLVAVSIMLSVSPAFTHMFGRGYLSVIILVDVAMAVATLLFLKNRNVDGARHFLLLSAASFPAALISFFL